MELDAARLAARAPLRTIRVADLAAIYAHPRQAVRALERRGILHRLAHGFYCAVPPEQDPQLWRPRIEAAAAGVAAAIHGDRIPVLTGLSAARVHQALPRAIATGYIAVPTTRRALKMVDRTGTIRFLRRSVAALDAELVATDLGPALATTAEQTVLDLARADPHGADPDVGETIAALRPGCDSAVLERIAQNQQLSAALARVRAAG